MSAPSTTTLKQPITLEELAKEPAFSALVENFKKAGPLQKMQLLWDFDAPKKRLPTSDQKRLDDWLMNGGTPSWLSSVSVQTVNESTFDPNVANAIRAVGALTKSSVCPDCNLAYRIGTKCSETGMYHMS